MVTNFVNQVNSGNDPGMIAHYVQNIFKKELLDVVYDRRRKPSAVLRLIEGEARSEIRRVLAAEPALRAKFAVIVEQRKQKLEEEIKQEQAGWPEMDLSK